MRRVVWMLLATSTLTLACGSPPAGAGPTPNPSAFVLLPTATSVPTPTATPTPPLAERIETLWAKADWFNLIGLLETERKAGRLTDELQGKLYAAYVNDAQDALKKGQLAGADASFQRALLINPNGGEATLGLKSIENARLEQERKAKEAAKAAVRAESKLELMPGSRCDYDRFGFFTCVGQVKNISGQSMRSVMAVISLFTDAATFVDSDSSFIEFNPILPNQVSPYKVLGRWNPAATKWKVEFKEFAGGKIPHYVELD